MSDKLSQFSKKPFVRNVAIMATGTVGAQIVTMAASPLVTRIYGPEALGLLGIFMSVVKIIQPISSLTYPLAIVLPKENNEARALVRLSLYISTALALFTLFVFMLFKNPLTELFQIKEITPFLYLIPLIILISGFMRVAEQWLIRVKQFGINAKISLIQSFILQSMRVGIGLVYPIAAVLVILVVFGNALKALMLFFGAIRLSSSQKIVSKETVDIKKMAKKHRDFPQFRMPLVLLNGISQNIPLLLLSMFFGPGAAGFYQICRTSLQMPSRLIGKSVGDVFFPRITGAANSGENVSSLIIKATLALMLIGIIPFGLVIGFGPILFEVIFGSNWGSAGEYAQWMALWIYSGFIYRPAVRTLPVLSEQKFHLIFTIFRLIVSLFFLATGYYVFTNDVVAIALYSISMAAFNIGLLFVIIDKSKNGVRGKDTNLK